MAAAAGGGLNMRMRLGLSLGLLFISVCLLFLFVALTERPADKAKAFPRGLIAVGVDASAPPFASDDGQAVTGLDIDLANAIARQIELPLRFVNISYYGLYDALISGEVELLISALPVEAARMHDVRYTRHYFNNGLLLVAPGDKPITSLEGLARQKIAYELGSAADTELRKLEDDYETVTGLPYELPRYALDALRLAYADAAIVDATAYGLYQRQHPDWSAAHTYLTQDHYAIAARRDNLDAWRLVDEALAALKESGELARIIARWL